jgi:uncharacterized membrane protein YdjX (TVP38/TMEM64 family)
MNRPRVLRLVFAALLACLFLGSIVVATVPEYRDSFNARLTPFLQSVERLGAWGPVAIGAAYIPACVLFLPGSPLTLFSGFAFGVVPKAIAASVGSTLGATAAFLVGRTLARGAIESKVNTHPKFRAIDEAVAKNGFKIVLLTRLSPVFPFNLLNYAFGLTKVSLRDYMLASWIGMFPGTLMFAYVGSTARDLAAIVSGKIERTGAQQALFYAGLAATLLVTILITRIARRALDSALK